MNELLIWMSARVEGSWQQFRSAVEAFHVESGADEDADSGDDNAVSELPLYQAVRLGLERLAHVEFRTADTERRWRVVPPALAVNGCGSQWVGIVCGARSPGLCATLNQLPPTVSWDSQEMPGMPHRIRLLSSRPQELDHAGERMGFLLQRSAPAILLAAIPPVDDPRSWFPADPPLVPGWTIDQFSPTTLRWGEAEPTQVGRTPTGLFRFRLRYQRFHFLRWHGRTFRVPVQVGKYAVLRHRRTRRLVQYDRARSVLSVPVSCRPPLLIERALVLCSGLLARLNAGRLQYEEVPVETARLAAGLLCQEIEYR